MAIHTRSMVSKYSSMRKEGSTNVKEENSTFLPIRMGDLSNGLASNVDSSWMKELVAFQLFLVSYLASWPWHFANLYKNVEEEARARSIVKEKEMDVVVDKYRDF